VDAGKAQLSKTHEKNKSPFITNIYRAFLENETLLKSFLGRFLYKPEDVDDMAQEAFLRAYNATRGREIESPKAYLFQVARTMAFKELTKKSRQLTDYLEEAQNPVEQETSLLEEEIAAQQKLRVYCEAIAELPPQCRRIFLMRKVQALSHKAIAQELNISVSAVEKQIALGVDRCKTYVAHREQMQNCADDSSAPPDRSDNIPRNLE